MEAIMAHCDPKEILTASMNLTKELSKNPLTWGGDLNDE